MIAYGTRTPPSDAAALREVFLASHPSLRGRRILLFLSRIHEKKGCDLLVRAFARAAVRDPALHLVIAGPDQTGWVSALQSLAREQGVADRISWPGMLRNDMKWGAFYSAEAFVLPSHQENFGIAVAEALGCGLPALISDKVNIWREVPIRGSGSRGARHAGGHERAAGFMVVVDTPPQRNAMGDAARDLFMRRFTVDAMAHGLLNAVQEFSGHIRPVAA